MLEAPSDSDPGIDSSESRLAQLTFMSMAHGDGGATTGTVAPTILCLHMPANKSQFGFYTITVIICSNAL